MQLSYRGCFLLPAASKSCNIQRSSRDDFVVERLQTSRKQRCRRDEYSSISETAFNPQAGPDESLADVASRILRNNVSSVPIFQSENGSCPRLLHVACLSGVLKCTLLNLCRLRSNPESWGCVFHYFLTLKLMWSDICSHFKHHLGYLTLLQRLVGYHPIGTWAVDVRRTSARPLLTLHPNATLSSALALLLEGEKPSPWTEQLKSISSCEGKY